MKNTIIILLLIAGTLAAQPVHRQPGEGCTENQGHVIGALDSVHRGDTEHHLDSLIVSGILYEHRVIVDWDTIYYSCVRCDSSIYMYHDTIWINMENVLMDITPDAFAADDLNANPAGTEVADSVIITGITQPIILLVRIADYIPGFLEYKVNAGTYAGIKEDTYIQIVNDDELFFKLKADIAFSAVTVNIYNYTDSNTLLDSFTIKSEAE